MPIKLPKLNSGRIITIPGSALTAIIKASNGRLPVNAALRAIAYAVKEPAIKQIKVESTVIKIEFVYILVKVSMANND